MKNCINQAGEIMKKSIFIALLITLIAFNAVQAQKAYDAIHLLDREWGIGTRALAMGGAYTALADDYSAIYWNPAGLGYITDSQISIEISQLGMNNKATYLGSLNQDNQSFTNLKSLGFAYPIPTIRGSAVIAVGFNRISDYSSNLLFTGYSTQTNNLSFEITTDDETAEYLFDTNVQRMEQVDNSGGLNQWSLGGAFAVSPNLLLGATFSVIGGGENYIQQFQQEDVNNLYNQYPADFDSYTVNRYLETEVSGIDLTFGANLQLARWIRIGGLISLPSRLTVKETHSFDDKLIFDDNYVDETEDAGSWEYVVVKPFDFNGGAVFTTRYLTLTASARYKDWSQVEFDVTPSQMDEVDYRETLLENGNLKREYAATTEYHVGGELRLPLINTLLRGGYAYYPDPLISAGTDRDRLVYSTGVSFEIDQNISFDITYLQGNWNHYSYSDLTPAGTLEEITIQQLMVGLSSRF